MTWRVVAIHLSMGKPFSLGVQRDVPWLAHVSETRIAAFGEHILVWTDDLRITVRESGDIYISQKESTK